MGGRDGRGVLWTGSLVRTERRATAGIQSDGSSNLQICVYEYS